MNLLNKKGLVIRHLPRHDEAVLRRCERPGWRRSMKPGIVRG